MQGKTVVGDLEGSKYGYNISEANALLKSGFEANDAAKGGGNIYYYQKGGSHVNAAINNSAVVLGHELYHGWAFEFTNQTRGMNFGQRLLRETSAVKFENYLRATFGETIMRTHYRLEGNNEKVASSSLEEAKNYRLPQANYMKAEPQFERRLQRDVDNTYVRPAVIPIRMFDTRKLKL